MNPTSSIRTLVCLGVALVAMVAARGSAAAPLTILDTADPRPHRVRQLHDDIALANLIHGLNLTGDQLDALAELATRADEVRSGYERAHVEQLDQMDSSFSEMKQSLLEAGEVPPQVQARARAAETGFKEQRLQFQEDLAELDGEVRQVLSVGQAQIVEEFRPCLFPPEDLSSPLRVGQAGASGHLVERLDEIRQLPPDVYERRLPHILDRAMERLQWHEGPIGEVDEASERERVVALLDEVRQMDDLAWALEGERMADTLVEPLARPPVVHEGRSELTRVGMLLLAPGASDVIGAIAERS